jgi:hypothetical protein
MAFLSPLGFTMKVKSLPHVSYFVQSVTIPSIELNTADIDTPFQRLPFPGTRMDFGDLTVSFKIDEDLKNYKEIYNWMIAIGFPDDFEQYAAIANKPKYSGEGVQSDISLLVLSSAMNPIHEFVFYDCFPIGLSGMSFESTGTTVGYLTANVTFANRRFEIKSV